MSSRGDRSISATPRLGGDLDWAEGSRIAVGNHHHHAALRALAGRWLAVLWHCLRPGVPYDEDVHTAHRHRARTLAG